MILTNDNDRRLNNHDTPNNRSDVNLADRINKFADVINTRRVYRIPLHYLVYKIYLNS